MSSPSIWIIAGETSGDDYGAGLARRLRARRPDCLLKGMGGNKMREAGVELFVDSSELGFIGIFEVLKHVFFFAGLLRRLAAMAKAERPEAVVLIDYPGFNIRLAQRLHKLGIPVIYYVSPQVWAWKKGRIKTLARCVDLMLCLFPFEPKVYGKTTLRAEFVGHPLLQRLLPLSLPAAEKSTRQILLLPGSRRQELQSLLPDFLRAAARLKAEFPDLEFAMPLPRQSIADLAQSIMAKMPETVQAVSPVISIGDTREKIASATAAIAASGTVTVEAAILDLPTVVAYRLKPTTWWLAKRLVKLPWATIANLVVNQPVFTELLQDKATPENLADAVRDILPGSARRQTVLEQLATFRQMLGQNTDVDDIVAAHVLSFLHS